MYLVGYFIRKSEGSELIQGSNQQKECIRHTNGMASDRLITLMTIRMTQANERNAVLSYSGGPGFKCFILTTVVVFSFSTSLQMLAWYFKFGLTDFKTFHYSTYLSMLYPYIQGY
jgi:hypothetical protein